MTRNIISHSAIAALLLSLLGGREASAARETDVAASLHGEVGIGATGYAETGQLEEHGVKVGKLNEGQTGFQVNLRFGVLPGLELFGAIPSVSSGHRTFSDVAAILPCNDGTLTDAGGSTWVSGPGCPISEGSAIYKTIDEKGRVKYVANDPADASTLHGFSWSGLGDVLIGLRFAPFHEAELGRIGSGRRLGRQDFNPGITWRFELGLLISSGGNIYSGGPGIGSTGFRFGTSFSKRLGVSEPYITFSQNRYGTFQAPIKYAGEEVLTIDPPNDTNLLFGIELIPYEDQASGAKFSVDFATGAEIRSAAQIASGTKLPGVLGESALATSYTSTCDVGDTEKTTTGTLGNCVRENEQVAFLMRLQLHYQVFRYVRIQAGGSIGYVMPHQLESAYSIDLTRAVLSRFGVELASTF